MDTSHHSTNDLFRYDPNNLLDHVKRKLGYRSDAKLSFSLAVAPPVISKIRKRKLPVGHMILIRLHEITGISIKDLRALMGDHRPRFLPLSKDQVENS